MKIVLCRWVVIHGMGGFGKTVLAAEAVRDDDILTDIFPGTGLLGLLLIIVSDR